MAYCSILVSSEDYDNIKVEDIKLGLQSQNTDEKIEALKQIIYQLVNGNHAMNRLLMDVIKTCLKTDSKPLKKLLMVFWEIIEKTDENGNLLSEMILICNYFQQDLEHSNEFVRGATLRLLTRVNNPKIIENVKAAILECLTHRHSYVRKNAVLCVLSIYKNSPDLLPEAPQRIFEFIEREGNSMARRNAFLMLCQCCEKLAVEWLNSNLDGVRDMDNSFQMIVLELIRKVCRKMPARAFIKCVWSLLSSGSNAVVYEAANTLIFLCSGDSAARAALSAMTTLLGTVSDQNVKLIIMNRLHKLKYRFEKQLQSCLMDVLRTLSTPNIDIRRKILGLTLELTSPQNVEDVVMYLKKELVATENSDQPSNVQYRNELVSTIHMCAVKFPEVAHAVVHLLLNYMGDDNAGSAKDVVVFVREIMQTYPDLRGTILEKIHENFGDIRNEGVFRVALWIMGEYSSDPDQIEQCLKVIKENIGELPLKKDEEEDNADGDDKLKPQISTRTVVLDDGTYATQQTITNAGQPKDDVPVSQLRQCLLRGEYFLASVIASTLQKLCLRLSSVSGEGSRNVNIRKAEAMLILTAILRLGASKQTGREIDSDAKERIMHSLRTLIQPNPVNDVILEECRTSFKNMISSRRKETQQEETKRIVQPHTFLDVFGEMPAEEEETAVTTLNRATGNTNKGESDFAARLSRVFQLTGFSDPVYAEACVTVHQFDIVLDIYVINKTDSTLQNLTVELHTSGDMRLVEKPQKYTLGPRGTANEVARIKTSIKVASTENGVIFGNIVYGTTGATCDKNIVVMNSIHMDIVNYILPDQTPTQDFSEMWAEFEWENKVPIKTNITDLSEYLEHIEHITNMKCLTPRSTLKGSCQFLAANLYARSIFGEDALLNLSVTKEGERVGGYIRIRSKTQGIALSLGDKITTHQKEKIK